MSTIDTRPLIQEGQLAMHTLRRALSDLVVSAGGRVDQPQEISRKFGIDKTLAWRVTRATREEDPWEALQHLPTRSGIMIFAEAMAKAGAPQEKVDALHEAFDAFERFVQTHARDRDTLDMIVNVPSRRSSEKKLESFRRGGFQCNCSLLGVRASMLASVRAVAPSATAGTVDVGTISCLADLCRLRSRMAWPVATVRFWGGLSRKATAVEGGRELTGDDASVLMREFCSPSDLKLELRDAGEGVVRHMLAEGPVGYSASATVVSGWVNFATASLEETEPGELGEHGMHVTTPVEELVFDLMIHESMGYAMDVTAQMYSQFPGVPTYPQAGSEQNTLPVPLDVVDLGNVIGDAPHASVGQYAAMVERLTARMGRSAREFRTFRYRLKYPPVPSMCVLRHGLKKR